MKYLTNEDFKSAFIGFVTEQGKPYKVVYDRKKCIDIVIKKLQMTEENAIEFFERKIEQDMENSKALLLCPLSYEQYEEINNSYLFISKETVN